MPWVVQQTRRRARLSAPTPCVVRPRQARGLDPRSTSGPRLAEPLAAHDSALHSWIVNSIHPTTCQALGRLLASNRRGPATFDADGTLWDGDVGRGFFGWMLEHKHYPPAHAPMLRNAYRRYLRGELDGEKMYELMVTGMAGLKESRVKLLAERYFDEQHKQNIFKPMAVLVGALRHSGFAPWVVSGSPFWVVAAGARHFGIPADHVIGLAVKVDQQGRLTDEVVRPVPWKQGKAQRILSDIGQAPLLAAGNSFGDVQMLRIAAELPLVINPEPDFLRKAQLNGWPVNNFSATDTLARWLEATTAHTPLPLPLPPPLARAELSRVARAVRTASAPR